MSESMTLGDWRRLAELTGHSVSELLAMSPEEVETVIAGLEEGPA